jgi:integral membrane protein
VAKRISGVTLRGFQVTAIAEGGLLPAILITAVVHWVTGAGGTAVAVVGASHGIAFTVYLVLVPPVAWLLRWPWRTTSVAFSVAFVPFAPWAFERRVHGQILGRIGDMSRKPRRHGWGQAVALPLGDERLHGEEPS